VFVVLCQCRVQRVTTRITPTVVHCVQWAPTVMGPMRGHVTIVQMEHTPTIWGHAVVTNANVSTRCILRNLNLLIQPRQTQMILFNSIVQEIDIWHMLQWSVKSCDVCYIEMSNMSYILQRSVKHVTYVPVISQDKWVMFVTVEHMLQGSTSKQNVWYRRRITNIWDCVIHPEIW